MTRTIVVPPENDEAAIEIIRNIYKMAQAKRDGGPDE